MLIIATFLGEKGNRPLEAFALNQIGHACFFEMVGDLRYSFSVLTKTSQVVETKVACKGFVILRVLPGHIVCSRKCSVDPPPAEELAWDVGNPGEADSQSEKQEIS